MTTCVLDFRAHFGAAELTFLFDSTDSFDKVIVICPTVKKLSNRLVQSVSSLHADTRWIIRPETSMQDLDDIKT